jgi:HK97 family phage prohead protease
VELVRIAPELRTGNARRRDFSMRAKAEDGRVKGYASVWGSLNSHGEIYVPGAFADTLATKSADKPLVMKLEHRDLIGKWDVPPSKEDETGLYLEGGISATTDGRDAQVLVNDGALTGLSIGFWPEVYAYAEPGEFVSFDTPIGRWSSQCDDWCIYMLKVDLVETSLVGAPSDDEARLRARDVAELLDKAQRALPALREGSTWEDAAYSLALLLGGRGAAAFRELPDLEHRKLFARVAETYAKFDRQVPAYSRFPDYAAIEFRHDERDVFSDRYLRKSLDSVVAGSAGIVGPLSDETRAVAQSAIAALTDACARTAPDEATAHGFDLEGLAEVAASLRSAAGALRQTDSTDD